MRNTKRIILTILLLATVLCLPVSAQWQGDVTVSECEAASQWIGHETPLVTNKTDAQQGEACVEWTTNAGFVVNTKALTPVDATGANTLQLDLYVSSAQDLYTSSTLYLELTSSGTYDVEESAWNIMNVDLVDGWNHLVLPLAETAGQCDLSRVNFIRFYALDTKPGQALTLRLDNIRLTYISDEIDTGDHVIGKQDGSSATPVLKDIAVNVPYDPWSEPTQDDTPSDEFQTPIAGIVCLALGGAVLVAAVVWLVLKKSKVVLAILSSSCAVCLIVGTVLLLLAPTATDGNGGAPKHPYFTTDQTGHPEVSADTVDVETLLTVNPDYSVKDDYKILYKSTPVIADFSNLPHLTLHEGVATENGLCLTVPSGNQPEYLHLKERDCWMFQYWDDTNVFSLKADDASRAAYADKEIVLNLVVYVTEQVKITLEYTDTAGEARSLTTGVAKQGEWTTLSVVLEDIALNGTLDGSDILVSCKNADITRVSAIYLSEVNEKTRPQTGLIHAEFETDSYIVADANVVSFGATGNGYTDDTEAFQRAIAEVAARGGGTVFVPAGYYCLTETLTLPNSVGLVGELEQGTARGSVLCIYGGKGSTDVGSAAVLMSHQSAVINLAFWYPEQTFVNGQAIPYPPTLVQNGSESVTVRNVTLVNSYIGIHFAKNSNNSLQYVRDVYATCLETGYINNNSYDIGRIENVTFSPDIWLSSGLPGMPNAQLLRTYMIRNATGMILQRIDWTYLADITVEGYHTGVLCNASESGTSNGHMYRVHLLDCYYGLYADELSWMMVTDCIWRSAGGEGATPLYISENCGGKISLSACTLETNGANALLNYGKSEIALMDCALISSSDSTYVPLRGANDTLINTTLSGNTAGSQVLSQANTPLLPTNIDYGKTVVTKPASDAFIDLSQAPYSVKSGEDITERLQGAIDSLKDSGGTVYIPAGQYRLTDYINVWAGIEVRGAVAWPQNLNATSFLTKVGENDPDGQALFTLYDGAGLRGIAVIYEEQHTTIKPYSYTVRGNGEGIYLVAVSLPTSWRGVDFATHRCDDHYVEYLWMAPVDTGIIVGSGSENGIIRDCHFTPNTWCLRGDATWWDKVYNIIMDRSRPYVIGESKNQILYHNFVYGAREGLSVLDGAQDVYLLCHGVDSGYISASFSGDCSVIMVDSQLVNLHKNDANADMHYLVTTDDFTGELTMINSSFWGSTKGAWRLNGSGSVMMYGVQMHSAGSLMCELKGGALSLWGMLESSRTKDFFIGENAEALVLSGNVFPGGLQIETADGANAEISGTDITD